MAEYILKFNEECCPANKVNYVNSFTFTPNVGTGATITSLENTIFAGNVTDYVRIIGNNVVDDSGNINGTLDVNIQCLDWCELSFWNNLFPVQIGGFALVIPTPARVLAFAGGNCIIGRGNQLVRVAPMALPLGEKVKIQLMGGVGNVRFVRAENSKILKTNNPVLIENFDFRPEMKTLAPQQVQSGDFVVDRDLGEGFHISEIEAVGIGRSLVTFTDEAGCFYIMAIDVKPNLCNEVPDQGEEIEEETDAESGDKRKGNVYKEIENNSNDGDFDETHQSGLTADTAFCHDCELNGVAGGEEEVKLGTLPLAIPVPNTTTQGFEAINSVYKNNEFVHGTRSLDLKTIKDQNVDLSDNFPVKMAAIHEMHVGEKKKITMPNIGGKTRLNWEGDVIQWEKNNNGGARGAGWSEENFGPIWSRFDGVEDSMVSTRRVRNNQIEVTCNQPTNFLPTAIHFYPRQDEATSLGGPIPVVPKEFIVNNTEAGAVAKYQSNSTGNIKYLHAIDMQRGVSMTNSDFFVGVKCFCPDIEFDIDFNPNAPILHEAGGDRGITDELDIKIKTIPNEVNMVNGGTLLTYLPKNRRHFLTEESIVGMGKFPARNIICEPSKDGIAPTVDADGSKKFKICNMSRDGTLVWKPLQLFFTHTTNQASPLNIHSPSHEVFQEEVYTDGEFIEYDNNNSYSYLNHSPTANASFPCYEEQGNTVQTRGTWCISNAILKARFPKDLPVIKSNISGKPRALKGGNSSMTVLDLDISDMNPLVVGIQKLDKKSTLRIEEGGGGGIRG